jgi:hypothetical protein
VCGYTPSDVISVFDASLLWFNKNPNEQLRGYGRFGWIVLLTRDRDVCDLAYDLLQEIERGDVTAVSTSRLGDIPPSWKLRLGSIPADRNPCRTTVTVAELVKFAIKREERPKFLSELIAKRIPTDNAINDGESTAKQRTQSYKREQAAPAVHPKIPRKSYKKERAAEAIQALWPNGIPDQKALSNGLLCKRVVEWITEDSKKRSLQPPSISDDTILRAASRLD